MEASPGSSDDDSVVPLSPAARATDGDAANADLVLFFGGWLAWKNDLNGTWCFRRNSPLYWLQGHAVWHVLTMGALGCIYWFFRSEKISYS